MSLGDVPPWIWGDLGRHVQAEIAGRRDLDAEARKGIDDALSIMLHARGPRDGEGAHCPLCSLCGTSTVASFVRARVRAPTEVDFDVMEYGACKAGREERDALLCWPCLYNDLHRLDASLGAIRRILVESPGGQKHLPVFDEVFEQRLIRSLTGSCALCGRSRPGLSGPPAKTICLACYGAARSVRDAEMRRWDELRRIRDERFEEELSSFLAEMWAIAREDARGAMAVLERRGDLRRPEPPAPPPPPEGPTPVLDPGIAERLPEGLMPLGTRLARAVTKRLEETPLLSSVKSLWQSRPTRVSLGWALFESGQKTKTGGESTADDKLSRGAPDEPDLPRAPASPGGTGAGRGAPPIPVPSTPRDGAAILAIQFLDAEVERAFRHKKEHSGDLMGDRTGIARASAAFEPAELSAAMLERLLCSISMLRQLLELGFMFHDYTGDELIHEEIAQYEVLASWIEIGIHRHVKTAMEGGLVVSGGTREMRRRVAGALRRIVVYRTRSPFPSSIGSAPFWYIEAEDLYAMSESHQQEVRRQMLITPPTVMVFGADDLDRFIEETPKRVSARIVTYLFMNGQEHLNLDEGLVHVGPPPPTRPPPDNA